MKTAGCSDCIHAGAKIQMIGIAQNNLRLYIVAKLVHMNAFDGTEGTDRHENRSLDRTVVRFDESGARRAVDAGIL